MYYIDLKEFRIKNNFTQNGLAKYFSVNQSFISQIESGARLLPQNYISKILADGNFDTSMVVEEQENKKILNSTIVGSNFSGSGNNINNLSANFDKLIDEIAAQRRLTEKAQEQIDILLELLKKNN